MTPRAHLTINAAEVRDSGGILEALSSASASYLAEQLAGHIRSEVPDPPDRFVVHKHPHIDEYLAELLYRSSLPRAARYKQFQEQALQSSKFDSYASYIWPVSVVFGMGNDVEAGAGALKLFDEHGESGERKSRSCAQMVAEDRLAAVPPSISLLLREVNHIDVFGNAHEHHLGNIVKTFHEIPFIYPRNDHDDGVIQEVAGSTWKRAIVDAALASVVFCLENHIDLHDKGAIAQAVRTQLDRYLKVSVRKSDVAFPAASQRLRSNLLNLDVIFEDATLRKGRGNSTTYALDDSGHRIPQLLLLSRLCLACTSAWGEDLGFLILAHFFETMIAQQISFRTVKATFDYLYDESVEGRQKDKRRTAVGFLSSRVLEGIRFDVDRGQTSRIRGVPLWLVGYNYSRELVQPHKAVMVAINELGNGVGLLLITNPVSQTKALFKGSNLPEPFWEGVIARLQEREPGLWYENRNEAGAAGFLLNGTVARQYVDQSILNIARLAEICREVARA